MKKRVQYKFRLTWNSSTVSSSFCTAA